MPITAADPPVLVTDHRRESPSVGAKLSSTWQKVSHKAIYDFLLELQNSFFFFFLIYYPREGAFQNEETVLRLAGLRRKFLIHDLFYWHSEIRFLQQSLQI